MTAPSEDPLRSALRLAEEAEDSAEYWVRRERVSAIARAIRAALAASPANVSESEPRWGDGDAGEAAVLADWDAEQAELAFHQRVCLLDRAKCFADGEPWPCTYVRAHPTPPAASTLRPEDGLDAAWAEAEAALPEGWRAWGLTALPNSAVAFVHGRKAYRSAEHPTPAAALRALRAALTEPDA